MYSLQIIWIACVRKLRLSVHLQIFIAEKNKQTKKSPPPNNNNNNNNKTTTTTNKQQNKAKQKQNKTNPTHNQQQPASKRQITGGRNMYSTMHNDGYQVRKVKLNGKKSDGTKNK